MNKKKKLLSVLGVSTLSLSLGLAIPLLATTVYAGTAYSNTRDFSLSGKSYQSYSGITTGISNARYANAWSRLQTNPTNSSNAVPAGYLGAKARIFNSSDQLLTETEFAYNSQSDYLVNSPSASVKPATEGAAYSSYGIVAVYTTAGYSTYYTFKSPYQNG